MNSGAGHVPTAPSAGGGASWRVFIPVALVALLAQFSAAQDLFGGLTKPVVLALLRVAGFEAGESGGFLTVGTLEVPWSRDCAGLNLLVVLLAVTVWMQRHRPLDAAVWLRVLAALPAALAANVARVLTVVAYRAWFFPSVESPQLHYFIGLAWLVPFALVLVPPDPRGRLATSFELLHAAAVLALIAPMADAPGGLALTLAAVLTLAHCRLPDRLTPLRWTATAGWLVAAAAIILAGLESFWLPWLLVCPLLVTRSWLLSIEGVILLAGSQPMFQLLPWGQPLTWLGLALAAWKMLRPAARASAAMLPASGPSPARLALPVVAAAFCLPFLGSGLVSPEDVDLSPPESALRREIPGDGYQVRLEGQPADLGLFWYLPSGSQRHHTLKVCMKYRGIELEPAAEGSPVMTDGELWMREFFLLPQGLLSSHSDYVWATLRPGRTSGIHLIAVASRDAMTAEEFADASALVAGGIPPPTPAARP
jgi:exosortase/archaeosortase family protein